MRQDSGTVNVFKNDHLMDHKTNQLMKEFQVLLNKEAVSPVLYSLL